MARYSDTLRDQNGRGIGGALVSVVHSSSGQGATLTYDDGSSEKNPFLTNEDGTFYFNAVDDFYDLTFRYGGRVIAEEFGITVGTVSLPIGLIADSLGTSTNVAPSQNIVTASLDGKAPVSAAFASVASNSYGANVGSIQLTDRKQVTLVEHIGAALPAGGQGYWWTTSNGGARTWKIPDDIGVIDPLMCGAVGDGAYNFSGHTATGTDDRLAVQAAYDFFQTRGLPGSVRPSKLHNISSTAAAGVIMNVGLSVYGNNISTLRSGHGLIGYIFSAPVGTSNYRGLHLHGGGKVGADAATNRCCDKAGYAIGASVALGAISVTLANSGDSANFAAGDIAYIRTGQLVPSSLTEPDAELLTVKSSAAGVVTFETQTNASYQQEYFVSGTTGLTTTNVTANVARFELVNVTDRVLSGSEIDIDMIGENTTQVLNVWSATGVSIASTTRIWSGLNGIGGRDAKEVVSQAQVFHSGRALGYFKAPSTGCSFWDVWDRGKSQGYAYTHVHEGVKRSRFRLQTSMKGNVGETNAGFEVLNRGYSIYCEGHIDSGASPQSSIVVGNPGDTAATYVDGGVTFGPLNLNNNAASASAVLNNGAGVYFTSDPNMLGTNRRMSHVGYTRTPSVGLRVGNKVFGAFLFDRNLNLWTLGQDEALIDFSFYKDAVFDGTKTLRAGFSGSDAAYISALAIIGGAIGDSAYVQRGGTGASTSLGAPQSGTRAIVVQLGTESTAPTAGKLRITGTVARTPRTA